MKQKEHMESNRSSDVGYDHAVLDFYNGQCRICRRSF